jgi:hypothetical protein
MLIIFLCGLMDIKKGMDRLWVARTFGTMANENKKKKKRRKPWI